MEAEAAAKRGYSKSSKLGASSSLKKKRKPLSDLTNSANPNPNSSNSLKKPSNFRSKLLSPALNCSNLSDSSIGSSNFNTPVPGYQGKRKDAGLSVGALMRVKQEIGERTSIPYSAALNFPPVEKTKDKGKATIAAHVEKTKDRGKTTIPAHAENTKSKGKAIIAPRVEKTMEKGKATIVPYAENTKDKGNAVDVAFKVLAGEKTRDKSKGVAGYVSNHALLNQQSEGEGIALSRGNICLESAKDKGKKNDATPCLPSLAKTKDKGKTIVTAAGFPTLKKRKEKGQGVSFSYSCPPPLPKGRHIRNELNGSGDSEPSEFRTDPHMMHKKKRRCMPRDQDTLECILPSDFIEKQRAYFKEVDEFELLEEEASDNEK
ncbi:uncharacterized protein LOC108200100 [Daucus carota subsp. sativus]|uniref:uncharacterized protein LOC108200100 n=1 Tax=Daucus carota subsp. sativus TaxID=79200 RepID=UPI0007EF95B2|nr:PREDICTED: uncharacterized protein LOC108200100 [Daucus carota subsp. sativus]XP_017223654.1 PREDICTED: uncharacterized protein LOC108200100 [Daucus carota subsp. sativus]